MSTERSNNLQQILRLEVPLVVRLGERPLKVEEIVSLVPGAIIELPKNADAELDLLVNNKRVGRGVAVKVGENFGLRITFIGEVKERVAAMGGMTMTVTQTVDPQLESAALAA
ncbi:MAG: FliM/FliN family flagellar motor switch protein [Phycisphaeraceae bacterium]|nr:FliM/FliN family flagellar motor switch protein [Phycisphaeraceae bacterium]